MRMMRLGSYGSNDGISKRKTSSLEMRLKNLVYAMRILTRLDYSKIIMVNSWNESFQESEVALWRVCYGTLRSTKSILLKALAKSPIISENPRDILYIRSFTRSDLVRHSERYERALSEQANVVIFDVRKNNVSLGRFLITIIGFFVTSVFWWREIKKTKSSYPLNSAIRLSATMFSALNDFFAIYKTLFVIKKLVSFEEMVATENLCAQAAKELGVKTFALQHAIMPLPLEEGSTLDGRKHYNLVSYRSSVCANILCWGAYTESFYRKYTKNTKITIIGRPISNHKIIDKQGVTIIFESDPVMNASLLTIAQELEKQKINVSLWFKPGYEPYPVKSLRSGPLYSYILGGRSSLVFELGRLGCKVYVFKASFISEALSRLVVINDARELIDRLKKEEPYPHNIWDGFIKFRDPECVQRFITAINYD